MFAVVEWSPVQIARPVEWMLQVAESTPPMAVIRRLVYGDPNRPEIWFRAVTWSSASEERELLGFTRSFEAACELGWDWGHAVNSWRHYHAAIRDDVNVAGKNRPAAADMVRFYREHLGNDKRSPNPPGEVDWGSTGAEGQRR